VFHHQTDQKVSQTLVQIRSINTEPRRGNAYGEIKSGELVLKAFLIELSYPNQLKEVLGKNYLDNRHSIRQDLMIYFVPFAESRWDGPLHEHCRNFAGILVQRYHKSESVDTPLTFQRVGYQFFQELYDRAHIDSNLWEELCGLSRPELRGQDLVIV
jgi:hypothetical protein